MSTIVTRAGKGSPLTNNEVDANFVNLNTDKIQVTGTPTNGQAVTWNGTAWIPSTIAAGVSSVASADGSITVTTVGGAVDLAVSAASPASTLLAAVRNTTGATLTKGTAVYISGATGQISTVSKALATSDATSAQTLGLITSDLANNSNGYVTVIGLVANINTSAYTDGQQLYLSPTTAGTLTATKPYAPQHLVYVAVVEHAHPTQGKLFVKVQNGYELDEIHDVSAQSPTTGQTIVYNSVSGLWEKNTVSLTAGVNGVLPTANGGTNLSSFTSGGVVYASSTSALTTGSALTFDGTNLGVTGTTATIKNTLTATTASVYSQYANTGGTLYIGKENSAGSSFGSNAYATVFYDTGNNPMVFFTSSTERMRLNSTGLGIGTSSPTNKLQVEVSSADVEAVLFNNSYTVASARTALRMGYQVAGYGVRIVSEGNAGAAYSNSLVFERGIGSSSYSETMRINASGNVGIGTASPSVKLDVIGSTRTSVSSSFGYLAGYDYTYIQSNGATGGGSVMATVNFAGAAYQPFTQDASYIAWRPSATEGMRLTSTGLGIGTSSPVTKLTIGTVGSTGASSSTNQLFADYSTAAQLRIMFNNTANYIGVGTDGGSNLIFGTSTVNAGTSPTALATLTSSGNLGLGVTPSAWSGVTGLQLKSSSSNIIGGLYQGAVSGNNAGGFSYNSYYNGTNWQYIFGSAHPATRYEQSQGAHAWHIAGSSTGTISFTQAMTLDASGNLGVGATSPAFGEGTGIELIRSGTATFRAVSGGQGAEFRCAAGTAEIDTRGAFPIRFLTNQTERVRIDTSGNLGIGTSSPSTKLNISGTGNTLLLNGSGTSSNFVRLTSTGADGVLGIEAATPAIMTGSTSYATVLYTVGATPLQLGTNSTVRATIDASGNLGLGVTPSGWSSIFRTMQIGTDGAWVGGRTDSQNQAWIGTNAYYNGANWIYKIASTAGQQLIVGNVFQWLQAPTGSIGGTATFTQAMTLDASGNLALGKTSASYRLDVSGQAKIDYSTGATNTGDQNVTVVGVTTTGAYASSYGTGLQFQITNSSGGYSGGRIVSRLATDNNTANLVFQARNYGFTDSMTLDTVGNVLIGGTAARGTTVGTAHLDLFNGTAPAGTLTNGVSLYSSSGDLKFMDSAGNAYTVGFRNVPQSGSSKTASYTLATTDVGEYILLGASGAIVIPDATFAAGDVITIFNNTASTATITCSITTAYIAGTFTDKATMTLAAAGVATVLFITSTLCVVSGNVT